MAEAIAAAPLNLGFLTVLHEKGESAEEIAGSFVRRLGEETGTTVVDARR